MNDGKTSGGESMNTGVNALLSYARIRAYPRKSIIVRAEDKLKSLYYVVDGTVTVFDEDMRGHEMILFYLDKGKFFGETGLFFKNPQATASIITKTKCEIAKIPYSKTRKVAKRHPALLMEISSQMAEHLDTIYEKIFGMRFLNVEGCVAQVLMMLARRPDARAHSRGIQIKITQEEVSRIAGYTRGMVSRTFTRLEEKGYIENPSWGTVILLNARKQNA